ncbi:MAG: lytic transglycosylase domain-containing protein [Fibrobacter sp.]|nr:lytic transglycosylase domain-containing protein [Fibrobacter sp.]
MSIKKKCILLLITLVVSVSGNINFPIPESLTDNVAFWKKIYTEVSLEKGLLHDRDYPRIIYDTITVGQLYGKELDAFVDKPRKRYINAIHNVKNKPPQTWDTSEIKVAELFKDAPKEAFEGAEERIRFQLGQRERFLNGIRRSGAFIDTIRAILQQRGLPLELAWLPHVESSFNVSAISKSGASGIWQFMPATGKRFLKIDNLIDERNDPVLSTIAAAKLLELNFQKLKSWPLAVTAYNYGLSGMLRAVEATGSKDLGVIVAKHQSPIFRFASKNFYSCFLAAVQIASEAEKYFTEIQYDKPVEIIDIKLVSSLRADSLCSMLGYTSGELGSLNPFFRSEIFKKNRTIPAGTIIRVRKDLDGKKLAGMGYTCSEPSKIPNELSETDTMISNVFKDAVKRIHSIPDNFHLPKNWLNIEFIDTAFAVITVLSSENIVGYAQWLGVSSTEILTLNKLKSNSSIYSGEKLVIPLNTGKIRQFLNARKNFHLSMQNRFFEKYRIKEIQTRVLKHGELIWNFCQDQICVPVWLFENLNQKLDLNNLSEGDSINVPILIKVGN